MTTIERDAIRFFDPTTMDEIPADEAIIGNLVQFGDGEPKRMLSMTPSEIQAMFALFAS